MGGAVRWCLCALVLGCASAPAPTQTASPPPAAAPATVVAAQAPDAGRPPPLFRLPVDVHPGLERVFLEVVPDREDFRGEVDLELVLDSPRQDLWVSARGLTFQSAEIRTGSARVPATVQADDLQGVARVLPSSSLPAGPATLHLAFSGRFLTEAYGAYRSRTTAGWAAYTQFESIDARRAFPCFDEPGFKIPWEVTLRIPARLLAVSNTNVAEERAAGEGMKEVRFRRTRPLPSYLVAFGVGDFEVVAPAPLAPDAVRPERLQIRGVVPKGRGPELAYALKSGGELLGALERWFEIPFAYEKLDHLAAPDMDGAMENAGLITYVDDALLETANSSDADRVGIASFMTHEMAHQWFGDLVTMRFWDDVWLNESFATFMAAKIVQQWDPRTEVQLKQLEAAQRAMFNDELETSRPVRHRIETEGDISAWDFSVLYPKGSAVLTMFENLLGRDVFRRAIHQYLVDHRDGNATSDDLFAALSTTREIRPAVRSFVEQPGVPRVRVEVECSGAPRVKLAQERALPLGSRAPRDLRWQIPVCLRVEGWAEPVCNLLTEGEQTFPLPGTRCPTWVHPNAEGSGYYRWALPPQRSAQLLGPAWGKLSQAERLSVANTLVSASRDGTLPAAESMAVVRKLTRTLDPPVNTQVLALFGDARRHWTTAEDEARFAAFMRASLRPLLARAGWANRRADSWRVKDFRGKLIDFLGLEAHDRQVLDRATRLGRTWLGLDGPANPGAVSADLRGPALRAAARSGDARVFAVLEQRLRAETDPAVRYDLASALGSFLQPELAARARALVLSPELHLEERLGILWSHIGTPELRASSWEFVVQHQSELLQRLPAMSQQFLPWMQAGCSREDEAELEQALAPSARVVSSIPFQLSKALEATRICAAVREAQTPSLTAFLARPARVQPASTPR